MTDPMSDERDLELYRQFRDRLARNSDLGLKLAPYPKLFAEDETLDGTVMPFTEVSSDTLRELANAVNEFWSHILQLEAWRPIYAELSQDEQYSLLLGHVRPIAHHCLNAPYAIRGRIIHATCLTSLFAGRFVDWPEGRPDWRNGHADMKTAKRLASRWKPWPALAATLGAMDGKGFREATGNIRDDRHHGHPRSVGMGHVWRIRPAEGERKGWSFGALPPLSIDELVPVLCAEHHLALAAFHAFHALLDEQARTVPRHSPQHSESGQDAALSGL